jgi:hypothetical protein
MARPGRQRVTPERAQESIKVRAARAPERSKLGLALEDRAVEL